MVKTYCSQIDGLETYHGHLAGATSDIMSAGESIKMVERDELVQRQTSEGSGCKSTQGLCVGLVGLTHRYGVQGMCGIRNDGRLDI
jgi:hypothetical protein